MRLAHVLLCNRSTRNGEEHRVGVDAVGSNHLVAVFQLGRNLVVPWSLVPTWSYLGRLFQRDQRSKMTNATRAKYSSKIQITSNHVQALYAEHIRNGTMNNKYYKVLLTIAAKSSTVGRERLLLILKRERAYLTSYLEVQRVRKGASLDKQIAVLKQYREKSISGTSKMGRALARQVELLFHEVKKEWAVAKQLAQGLCD